MNIVEAQNSSVPQLSWERVMSRTRYGRYAESVESSMVGYVLQRCPTPGVLLDVGCEGGRRSKVFADRGWQIIAMDVDARALRVCQSRIPEARCVLTSLDSRQLAAESESVDIVLCIEVGPVIHTDWAVREFARVLKPGGRLVGVTWNRTSWRGLLYHNLPFLRVPASHPMYGFPIKYKNFRQQMSQCGFQFEKEVGFAWGPFRRSSNSPLVNLWAICERFSGLQQVVPLSPMVTFVSRKM